MKNKEEIPLWADDTSMSKVKYVLRLITAQALIGGREMVIHSKDLETHFSLGDILIERGLVEEEQLWCALDEQREEAKQGRWLLLEEILIGWGLLTQAEINESLAELARRNELLLFQVAYHPAAYSHLKRIIDIVGALIGLGITACIFPWVALAIYLDDCGPVFFVQNRIGLRGRQFKIWKFRSMIADADRQKASVRSDSTLFFSANNDWRITRVGRILRKTMIDEFPQFWNVLIGEMSLVGTRPPTLDEVRHYKKHHWMRLEVKPGITGLWQASGDRHSKDFEGVLALDRAYQDRWSAALDLLIIAKTIYGALVRVNHM
jgi:lipopolysaccharide/colanic/teichoic acid biosynthesis glycosyltransferase